MNMKHIVQYVGVILDQNNLTGLAEAVREGLGQKVKNVKLVFAKKSLHISFLVQTAVSNDGTFS